MGLDGGVSEDSLCPAMEFADFLQEDAAATADAEAG